MLKTRKQTYVMIALTIAFVVLLVGIQLFFRIAPSTPRSVTEQAAQDAEATAKAAAQSAKSAQKAADSTREAANSTEKAANDAAESAKDSQKTADDSAVKKPGNPK